MEQGRLIFKVRTGSQLYGLQRPESDIDYGGVFIPKSEYILGLKKVDEVDSSTKSSAAGTRNTADDVDDKVYALPKYLHLALDNNPNIVEFLFATPENILVNSPEWQDLVANRDKIVSQNVYNKFKGYAASQKKKLIVKSERFNSLAKGLDWIEQSFSPEERNRDDIAINETDANQLNSMLKYYKNMRSNCESFHLGMSIKMIYEHLKVEYDTYGWRVHTTTFETLGFDTKFASHLIRLLAEGAEILRTGELHFPLGGQAREDIMSIRDGKIELKELLSMSDRYEKDCDEAYSTTKLPKKPNFDWANKWLINTLRKSIADELEEEETIQARLTAVPTREVHYIPTKLEKVPYSQFDEWKQQRALELSQKKTGEEIPPRNGKDYILDVAPGFDTTIELVEETKREEKELPPLSEEEMKGLLGDMENWDTLSDEALISFEEVIAGPELKLGGESYSEVIARFHKLPD